MTTARLVMELEAVESMLARPSRASLTCVSPDARVYEVGFDVRTLVCGRDDVIREEQRRVPVVYDLAANHPLENPGTIAGHLDLWNPNVNRPLAGAALPPLAFICLGKFEPAMRLADWIIATYRVLAWQRVGTERPLNVRAAAWACREAGSGRVPTDRRPFFDHDSTALGDRR